VTGGTLVPAPQADPPDVEALEAAAGTFRAGLSALRQETARVIVGQDAVVAGVLAGILAQGHVLLEGPPGLGKTLLARTIAAASGLHFDRVQCTPDLMPADVTGTSVMVDNAQGHRDLRFREGPVFTQVLLVDEINRAVPRTQSALLEAMQEGTVTAGSTTHVLPKPFMVLATQNPLGEEGTYRLPEAQRDRFMAMVEVKHPPADVLAGIIDRTTTDRQVETRCRLAPDFLLQAARLARRVFVSAHLQRWVADLVVATDRNSSEALPEVADHLDLAAGPRAGQAMLAMARVSALSEGRSSVGRGHLRQVAFACLRHRLGVAPSALARGLDHAELVQRLLDGVAVPSVPQSGLKA